MKQVKILHCADLHIGAELSSLGKKAVTRRAEIKRTFMNILKLCQEEQVQILLIAGDLFDNVNVQQNTLDDIKNGFEGLKDTIVAIAPGNHDPLTEDSPYSKENFWPDNVIIFKSKLEKVELESLGVRLWGAAFTGAYSEASLLQNYSVPKDGLINLCVIHGELVSENQKSTYNPITETQLKNSGMDYIALGHIHKQTDILKAGGTHYAYSGCPEGRGFDELEEKGVYIGTLSKGHCNLKYHVVCQRRNVELHVDISEAVNSMTAADMVRNKMKSKYGEAYEDNLYKVILEGSLPDSVIIDCDEIKVELNEVFYIKIRNNTRIKLDYEAVLKETTVRSIFVQKILDRIDKAGDTEKERLERALTLGMKAFSGEVKYSED